MTINSYTLHIPSTSQILVVDDEPILCELAMLWLSKEGFGCAAAANAKEAWEYLQHNDVHLVTLDINMPGESGMDLLRRIKDTYPDIEVVMLTARGETETAIEALTQGAVEYLMKPIDGEDLLRAAHNALERRAMKLTRRRHTEELERKVREQTRMIRKAYEETIYRLVSASGFRDEETGAHIRRVGLYSEILARAADWPREMVETIRMAAPMHDVGKVGIPDAILCKPGKLTDEEFMIMKRHTLIGAQILACSESPILQMAYEIALRHHERWDGGGYPAGLRGDNIPEAARIVAIVDVYDALSHDRVYRPAMPEDKVLQILREGRAAHFDPRLLDLFFENLSEMRRVASENPDEMFTCRHNPTSHPQAFDVQSIPSLMPPSIL